MDTVNRTEPNPRATELQSLIVRIAHDPQSDALRIVIRSTVDDEPHLFDQAEAALSHIRRCMQHTTQ